MRNALALFGLLLLSPSSLAWNESGHRVIAAAAEAHMSPALRGRVLTLLQAHPRYEKDLAAFRPGRLTELSDAQWLMGQAAQWPDHARSFDNEPRLQRAALVDKYHRGRWHYINMPVYLSKGDKKLGVKDPAENVRRGEPRDVLSALGFLQSQLRSPDVSDENKGLWISWALHLIADVHQPLHTTALFSEDRWPRGDRGGNEVKIAGTGEGPDDKLDSLHYFWDSALTTSTMLKDIRELVQELKKKSIPKIAKDETAPVKWIREGKNLANLAVYDPLRAQLVISPVVSISPKYARRAQAASQTRAALAARRTALWLEASLMPVD